MVSLTGQATRGLPPRWRLPLLLLGFTCLVTGVAGGLARSGSGIPLPIAPAIALHGVLMVSGFFGTVISLERAVALDRAWGYAAPLACGAGGIALLGGFTGLGYWMLATGAGILTAAGLSILSRRASLEGAILAAASACWLAGNVLLALGHSPAGVLGWWIAFFALTIGGERLELSRYVPRPRSAHWLFGAIAVAIVVGAAISLSLIGLALLALAAWLLAYDIAWKTARGEGLPRYIAICLLAGYFWLALGGAMLVAGSSRDAAIHALLVGFVFSMVFGHAPVIVPAVLRRALPYTAWLYVPLALLHASLAIRIAGGIAMEPPIRIAGSIGNAVAIALFLAAAAAQALRRGAAAQSSRARAGG